MNSFTNGISIKRLWNDSPFVVVMAVFNIVVFIGQLVLRNTTGYYFLEFNGSLNRIFIFDAGEYYRIFTYGFLHSDFGHIFFNVVFGLFIVTGYAEKVIGTWKTMLLYLFTLILSGFVTALLSGPTDFTLGASGAIFGILGALFWISVYRDDLMSRQDVTSIRGMLFFNLIFTLLFGSALNISILGHVSGVIFGFFLSYIFISNKKEPEIIDPYDQTYYH